MSVHYPYSVDITYGSGEELNGADDMVNVVCVSYSKNSQREIMKFIERFTLFLVKIVQL